MKYKILNLIIFSDDSNKLLTAQAKTWIFQKSNHLNIN